MVTTSVQDRTAEFRAVLAQAQKKQSLSKLGAQRQSLLSDAQKRAANGSPNGEIKGGRKGARSEFAKNAAQIGRGITGTMDKLQRLSQRRLWEDISELMGGYPANTTSNRSGQAENVVRRSACRNR